MVLTFLKVARPPGPKTWQGQIRDYIEKNTNATRPSLKKAPDSPDNPAFKEQKCDLCDGDYECWATTPNVLKKLLNANQSVTTYQVSKRTTERSATDAMLDNVEGKAGHRARRRLAALCRHRWVSSRREWIRDHIGRNLNGVWYCDPLDGTINYKKFSAWAGDYLYWVTCGTYVDTIVVIRATG